jgi:mannose-6-phosphate isomerase-like protein (cupin superfamily)
MLGTGSRYENPRTGGTLEVLEMTPELLRFERLYKPRTGRADPHLHLDFTHSWEVIAGRGRFELDGEERDLGPGESAEIELKRPHRDLFNPFEEEALARFEIRPCNRFVETFFETLVWLFERGRLDEQENFPQLQLFVILHATKAQSFAAGPPLALQRALLPAMAAAGRLRGYKPHYG